MDEQSDGPGTVPALASELRGVIAKLRRRLREQARPGDLTGSQMSVLRQLYRDGPATVTALAQAEGMRPQSMGANISILKRAGLVNGTADPADGRQTLWSLTAAARKRIEARRAARQDWLCRAIQANLAPAEQQELARAVDLLKRLVDT